MTLQVERSNRRIRHENDRFRSDPIDRRDGKLIGKSSPVPTEGTVRRDWSCPIGFTLVETTWVSQGLDPSSTRVCGGSTDRVHRRLPRSISTNSVACVN